MKSRPKKFLTALAVLLTAAIVSQAKLSVLAEESEKTTVSQDTAGATAISETVCSDKQIYVPEEGILADNDELAKGYIERVLGISGDAAVTGNYGESDLTGLDKTIYNLLKEKIAEVAAGTLTSTEFIFTAEDLGVTTYTAADLGVDVLVANNEITEEAMTAINDKCSYDFEKILDLLLVNCPYELYWYDKTIDTNSWMTCKYVSERLGVSSITFQMAVAKDYAASGETGTYVVGSKPEAITNAVENAENIVSENTDKTDYDKLLAYKNKICELVSYNGDAASDNYDGGYGNPWQLIYVFDGDDDTNVICEGYSKAFQYLCDLSEFSDENICCYTVTGTLNGGTGAGGHMWNIITMDDGKNYLADMTNSDSGTVGKNGELFLAGTPADNEGTYSFTIDSNNSVTYTVGFTYDDETTDLYGTEENSILNLASSNYETDSHIHTMTHHERVDATCTTAGKKEYYYCEDCKKYFSDSEGTEKITDISSLTLDAVGHSYGDWQETKAATCTEEGSKVRICTVCKTETETETIPAADHNWDTGKVTTAPTETTEGVKTYTCTVCGTTKTEKIAATGKLSTDDSTETSKSSGSSTETQKSSGSSTETQKSSGSSTETQKSSGSSTETQKSSGSSTKAPEIKDSLTIGKTVKINGAVYKVTGKKTMEYKKAPKTIKSITIPSKLVKNGVTYKVTSIAPKAFKNYKKLKKIVIPASVKKIGKQAFFGCKNLKKIIIKTTSLTRKSVGAKAFKSIYTKATIKVPKKKLKSYKKILSASGAGKKVKIKK